MKYIGLNELREMFLSFFESKAHYRLESFPLLPIDDDSLLLINSGMAPMKKILSRQRNPAFKACYNLSEMHKNAGYRKCG